MYKYDFGLSFAKQQRDDAKYIAECLKHEKINVFYDDFEEENLWGKDLYQEFYRIYGQECRFFIPFVSKDYMERLWPKHELKQAQARAFKSDMEYILPLKYDDTEVPGINITTGYIDMREGRPLDDVVQLCLKKLIHDSAVRELFLFLRQHNPDSMNTLNAHPSSIQIRVATNLIKPLELILSTISPSTCIGRDHHSMLMNGGNSAGCIPSIDPEPHTIFTLELFKQFYFEIPLTQVL